MRAMVTVAGDPAWLVCSRIRADTNRRARVSLSQLLTIVTPMPRTEPIKAVRGMRDLLPAERALWRAVEKAAARVARSFGYQEIVTPILEHTDLIERVGDGHRRGREGALSLRRPRRPQPRAAT